jgi:hypothetical protein
VVSEEKIFEKCLQTDDGRQLMGIAHIGSFGKAVSEEKIF